MNIIDYPLFKIKAIEINVRDAVVIMSALVLLWIMLCGVKFVFKSRARRKKVDYKANYHSIYLLINYVAWVFFVSIILSYIGLDLSLLVASSAALFVGVGLGLQQTFNDFVSGIIILLEGTIKVGDIVEIDNMVVQVVEIKLRTSRVVNRGDITVIVPNHKFIADNVINWTYNDKKARFSVTVGVDYSSDVRLVEKLLYEVADRHESLISDEVHKHYVRFADFGDSYFVFELFFHTDNTFRVERTKSDLRFMILEAFQKNGIKIPFPQRDIHVYGKDKKEL
jgi:small-conductance mechanosensitive channel